MRFFLKIGFRESMLLQSSVPLYIPMTTEILLIKKYLLKHYHAIIIFDVNQMAKHAW